MDTQKGWYNRPRKDVSNMSKRSFTPEYKKEIIRLITDHGKKIGKVARDIEVSETSIRKWIKQYSENGDNAFPGKGKLRPEDEEMRRLKKELADLKEENEILKKAMVIFTKPVK